MQVRGARTEYVMSARRIWSERISCKGQRRVKGLGLARRLVLRLTWKMGSASISLCVALRYLRMDSDILLLLLLLYSTTTVRSQKKKNRFKTSNKKTDLEDWRCLHLCVRRSQKLEDWKPIYYYCYYYYYY